MKQIFLLTFFLLAGVTLSLLSPNLFGSLPSGILFFRDILTTCLLAFIMIEVGRDFTINPTNKRQYTIDYLVAATAAGFPWILVSGYFFFFLIPENTATGRSAWIEALVVGRFAAPTSAGILFSMLAAAGLAQTWVFRKTRILAIFDDLDTVLLMIPLQILLVGLVWQLGGILLTIVAIIFLGIKFYRKLNWPTTWVAIMSYAFLLTTISKVIYFYSKDPVTHTGLHIEILLPAFVLGCALKLNSHNYAHAHKEKTVSLIVSSVFLFLVGFSMPSDIGLNSETSSVSSLTEIIIHVLAVTLLANIGKMFVCFCYKKEANFKERLAVSIALLPRGEVGAGVLTLALEYGMTGSFITIAYLSLTLNLILTGVFIYTVQKLLSEKNQKNHNNPKLERETGLKPATFALARRRSIN